jgi:hypothetical protein
MREAERGGAPTQIQPAEPAVSATPPATTQEGPETSAGLTRRQLRERGLLTAPSSEPKREARPEAKQASAAPVGSRRQLRQASSVVQAPVIEAPEIDIPEPEFNGSNLLAEPSTESIILERAPEAIELPISTGEITVTGSIQVITDSMSQVATSSTDAIDLDEELAEDAVTGVLSVVEPVSALDLIGERSSTGVVPTSALTRGRWKPLGFAVGSIILGAAAIWATLTIIGAAG